LEEEEQKLENLSVNPENIENMYGQFHASLLNFGSMPNNQQQISDKPEVSN